MNSRNSSDTSSLARGMIIAAWLVLLALLTLFFQRWEESENNPNQNISASVTESGVREIVLQRNRFGHYVASGEINGQPVEFLLDTGATTITIPENIANRLGLEAGHGYTASTANGNITVFSTQIDRLTLGNIELYNLNANINPHMKEDGILLGMNVLKKLELIQRGDTLTLRQYP